MPQASARGLSMLSSQVSAPAGVIIRFLFLGALDDPVAETSGQTSIVVASVCAFIPCMPDHGIISAMNSFFSSFDAAGDLLEQILQISKTFITFCSPRPSPR